MSSVSIRVRKLMLRLVAVLVVAVGIPVAVAGPASAHHPEITASVDCAGTVTYTAKSWVTSNASQKTNPNIGVYLKQANGSFTKIGQGAFAAPNYSFTGTHNIGSAASATIRVKADAPWASGAGAGDYRDVTVTVPDNCGTTTITNDCTTATVDLVNNGAAPKTYTITMAGKTTQTKTVAGKSSDKVTFTGLEEDATYTVTVKIGSTTVDSKTFTIDCTKPTASLETGCTQYKVTLNNKTSSAPTRFVVTVNGTSTTHNVGAKQDKVVPVTVVEGGTYSIQVSYPGGSLLDHTSTVDCEKPKAVITESCTGYSVLLDNRDSQVSSKFVVTIDGSSTTYTVTGGQTQTVSKTNATEGNAFTISVKHGSTVLDSKAFTIDCEQPKAVILDSCTGYTVTLNNSTSKVAVRFAVTVNGKLTNYDVPAGKTQDVTGTGAEGSAFDIVVKHGSTSLATKSFTIDCEQPTATVVNDCTTWTADLNNSKSKVAVDFVVIVNGGAPKTYTVKAGETDTATGNVAEGSSNIVVVKYGATELAKKSFTVDCEKPTATLAHTCTTWTATLNNTQSTVAVDFVVTVNGTATTYTVEKGKTRTVTGDVVDDQATTITVAVGKHTLTSDSFTEDCAKPLATITDSCTGYSVYLDNRSSKVAVDFDVTINGDITTHTVAAGKDEWIVEDAAEGDSFTISVTDGSKELAAAKFTIDCERPAATINHDCTGYTVTLDNQGSKVPVKFTVTVNGDSTDYVVMDGKKLDVTGDLTEDTDYRITVTSGKQKLAKDSFTVNCAQPEATVTNDCTGYTVDLDNKSSDVDVTFTVTVNGDATDYTVPAHGADEVTGPVSEGSSYEIVVSHGKTELAKSKFDIDCEKPAATIADSCTGYSVHLDNTLSSVKVTYTVTVNGDETDYEVEAGKDLTISENAAEGDSFVITVTQAGDKLASSSFTIDCEKPEATVTNDCTDYTAHLDNLDSLVAVTFTVNVNGVETDYTVPARSEQFVTGPVVEDSTNTVSVSHGQTELDSSTFQVDCAKPEATIVDTCTGYEINLDNTDSTVEVTFTVTVNGVETDYKVPAGGTEKVVKSDAAEGSSYDIEVTDGTTVLAEKVFTIDCAKPVATVVNDCTGYTITLNNEASTVPVTFTVTIDGVSTDHVVAEKATKVITDTVAEDSSHIISVANGTESLAESAFTVDCVKPTALVTQSCLGYDVTLDNSASTLPVEFTVTFNGVEQKVTVPKNAVQHVTGAVVEDSTNTITVRGGGKDLVSTTFTKNCETFAPAAAVTHDCATYTATLNNSGSNLPVEFTVNVNGASQVVTVPAGQTQQVTGPVTEDVAYTVTVSAGGAQLVSGAFTVDCVQGGGDGGTGDNGDNGSNGDNDNGGKGGDGAKGGDTPSSDDGVLPATGSPALLGLALLLGLGLVTGGGLLVAGNRRRLHVN